MADKTGIVYSDATWNTLRGCVHASTGCRGCYAQTMAARFSGKGQPYEGLTRGGKWTGEVRQIPHMLDQPLRWTRPRKIFVNSMSDLFHPDVPFDFIDEVFAVMALCLILDKGHIFQVLTKRPARMLEYLMGTRGSDWEPGAPTLSCITQAMKRRRPGLAGENAAPTWPLPNVWLGVTAEDQATADARIPMLFQCPAAVRWVSVGPMVGPIDASAYLNPKGTPVPERSPGSFPGIWPDPEWKPATGLDWGVVEGESGKDARPMHPEWVRTLRDQFAGSTAAFLFKQWGEYVYPVQAPEGVWTGLDFQGDGYTDAPFRVGKHRTGRLLDGVLHDEYPREFGDAEHKAGA